MLTRKSRLLLSLTAVTPLLFAACTDNTLTNPLGDVEGTYHLTVYAGHAAPATFTIQPGDQNYPQYPNGATMVVTGGTMVLNSNGTFTETNNYSYTPPGGPTDTDSFVSTGTWTLSGENFSFFAPAQNNQFARNISGTLTENINGNLTINYQESLGGPLESFEYQM
jgi:hypothetical protein